MPHEPSDPAAWWHGAEPMPPRPDELGVTPPLNADGLGVWLQPGPPGRTVSFHPGAVVPQQPAEVRAGDRVRMLHGPAALPDAAITGGSCAAPCTVIIRQPLEPGSGVADFYAVRPDEIGSPGSGKPWTLVAPEPVPHAVTTLPVSMGHIPGPPSSADLAAMYTEGLARIKARNAAICAAYDAPEMPSEGSDRARAWAASVECNIRMVSAQVYDVDPGPWRPPVDTPQAAAVRTLERMGYTHHGGTEWKPPLGPVPDFARMDAERVRQEALERVAEAARRCVYGSDQRLSRDYARLRAAVVALAALDGKRRA